MNRTGTKNKKLLSNSTEDKDFFKKVRESVVKLMNAVLVSKPKHDGKEWVFRKTLLQCQKGIIMTLNSLVGKISHPFNVDFSFPKLIFSSLVLRSGRLLGGNMRWKFRVLGTSTEL
jgi:hypothetical protein